MANTGERHHEPTIINGLGEAAACAAVQVLQTGRSLHELEIPRLQNTLREREVNL